ncbi:UNVERIFIED_CONTAM: cytochrome C, partial [Lactobacillus helveticus]|nr:cytochrome C [Lactobacillus helveticus]
PSQDFAQLSDEDTAPIIAYLHSAPPVDNTEPASSIGPLGRALLVFNQFPVLPAEEIDHTAVGGTAPDVGASAEYGEYLAVSCRGCHMANYAGGLLPGSEADAVPAANLTPAGDLATWTTEDFITTIRTGVNPEGHQLDPEMPWQA